MNRVSHPFSQPILSLLVGLALLANGITTALAQPEARLAVSPNRYEVSFNASGSSTESLMVKNLSDEPVTVRISLANWDLDDNNKVRVIEPREDSLDQWLVVNPLQVTIPPDTPQTIRWAIMPRQAPSEGEYRALLFVEEVLQERASNSSNRLRMTMRMGIPVYAQFGDATDDARIESVSALANSSDIVIALANEGNRHARFQGAYGVWPDNEFPGKAQALSALRASTPDKNLQANRLEEVVLLPGVQRNVTITPDLPRSGNYTVQFDAVFANQTMQQTVRVERRD